MANQVRVGVGVVLKGEKDLDKLRDKFDRLTKMGAKGFAIGAGAAVTTKAFDALGMAVSGVGDFIGTSIKAASDMNETLSKSKVIFGDSAKTVEDFGNTAAKSMGISKQAAVEAAAGFGNLFVGLDLGQEKAAEMSKGIVSLAGDLASFNNLDPTDVLQKLRSGLSGEAEPLRSLGVFLTEAKVKAKAMEMGLGNAHGELSEGAKLLARYKLITEETTTAQGDFARTADGLANSQRTANGQLADLEARLGDKLLPLMVKFKKEQVGILGGVADWATGMDVLQKAIDGGSFSLEEQVAAAESLKSRFPGLTSELDKFIHSLTGLTPHVRDDWAKGGDVISGALWTIPRAADAAGDAIETLGDKFNRTWAELTKAGTEAADDIYGPAERKADLAANKREIAAQKQIVAHHNITVAEQKDVEAQIVAQQRKIADLKRNHASEATIAAEQRQLSKLREQASGNVTAAEKRDAATRLIAVQKEGLGLRIEMAGRGELTQKAYAALISELQTQAESGNAEIADSAQKALAELKKLKAGIDALGNVRVGVTITGGKKTLVGGPHAMGGPVSAGTAYPVGEKGPELFVPGSSGTIVPHNRLGSGGGGGGTTLHLTVNVTPSFGMTPAQARGIGDAVGPAVYDYLHRRGAV